MHSFNFLTGGLSVGTADNALILIHGRGGSAEDILSLGRELPVNGFALFAPQAAAHSWYPYSFLAPVQQNEPWLSAALGVLQQLTTHLEQHDIPREKIWFAGFSQGACLMLEYLARNGARYGGAAAFTGGLIGDRIYRQRYNGDFARTPVFIGTGDPDPHVPVQRVHDTAAILEQMNADILEKIYPQMGHTITTEELKTAARHAFNIPDGKTSTLPD